MRRRYSVRCAKPMGGLAGPLEIGTSPGVLGAGMSSTGGCPGAGADARGLLELFLLEKAVYELAYELDNRPDWVAIPLRGLARFLDADA